LKNILGGFWYQAGALSDSYAIGLPGLRVFESKCGARPENFRLQDAIDCLTMAAYRGFREGV
jgi:hypothetical protein